MRQLILSANLFLITIILCPRSVRPDANNGNMGRANLNNVGSSRASDIPCNRLMRPDLDLRQWIVSHCLTYFLVITRIVKSASPRAQGIEVGEENGTTFR